MIKRITGKVIEKLPTYCVLDCHGLGIGLHISVNTYQELEKIAADGTVTLFTHLHVREDALQLFGFAEKEEQDMFELLITISGIGPKLAVAVLSGSRTAELRTAILQENIAALTNIPGVGKKTAQRVILELREKIPRQDEQSAVVATVGAPELRRKIEEARLGLVALGYKPADAQKALDKTLREHGSSIAIEVMIKLALKEL